MKTLSKLFMKQVIFEAEQAYYTLEGVIDDSFNAFEYQSNIIFIICKKFPRAGKHNWVVFPGAGIL